MVKAKKRKSAVRKDADDDNSVASRVQKYLCLHLTKQQLQKMRKTLGLTPSHLRKLHATKNEVSKALKKAYKSVPQEKADLVFQKFFNKLPKAGAKPKPML
jgi:hypothetical protein